MKIIFQIILFLSAATFAKSQESLSLKEFLNLVYQNHPLYNSAQLNVDMAAGKLRAARGNFDPKIEASSSQKTFNGSDYFDNNLVQLKVPIYSGIEIKTGYELNTGKYLNPEMTTPAEGLFYTELAFPVLKNLIINQGRAEVLIQQALYQQSQYEWQLAQNELVYLISSAYWEYKAAYDLLDLYKQAVDVAADRFSFVKMSYVYGKYAAIDTVEAYMEWQRRLSLLMQINAAFTYSSFALSNQYWLGDTLGQVGFVPQTDPILVFDTLMFLNQKIMVSQHPAIQQIEQKIVAAGVDKKLQQQNLLPEVNLRYKPLTAGGQSLQYSSENITWGATFQMPLFLRKETGKLKVAESKFDQLQYEKLFKIESLSNDLQAHQNALFDWQRAVQYQKENVEAAQKMLDAEKRKFELGSTTIFMVNYRERYLYESFEKLIKVEKEFNKAQSAYLNKLGVDVLSL